MRLLRKRKAKRLRKVMRGFRILTESNRKQLIYLVKKDLANTELINIKTSSKIFGTHVIDIELSLRQFLYVRLESQLTFNKAILYAISTKKPLRYPLPRMWQKAVKSHIKVDHLSCQILWVLYVFALWGYGVLQSIKSVYLLLFSTQKIQGNYIYFHQIRADSLPLDNKPTYNIVNWYLQWHNRTKNVSTMLHDVRGVGDQQFQSVNICYHQDGLPMLTGFSKFYYLLQVIYMGLYTLIAMGFGRYYYGVLFSEIIKVSRIRLAKKEQLAKDYLFHNSGPIYRPLWTYEAESRDSRILFYFYSSNIDRENIHHSPWEITSWSYYLVWVKNFKSFLEDYTTHPAKIEVVGVIWFSDSGTKLPQLPKASIAVFDVQPRRDSFFQTLGIANMYYIVPKIVNQFLQDIHSVCQAHNYTMVHKRKRFLGKFLHPKYQFFIKTMQKKEKYITIDPDLAATKLIKNTQATISMPFTSTALIAQEEHKPSIYYDPTGLVDKNDRARFGVPVLSNIKELQQWVKSL